MFNEHCVEEVGNPASDLIGPGFNSLPADMPYGRKVFVVLLSVFN